MCTYDVGKNAFPRNVSHFQAGRGEGGAFVDQQCNNACLETASFIAAASFAGISRSFVFPFSQVRPFFCQADWSQFPRNQAAEYLQTRDRPHFLVGKKLSPGNHADYRDCATMIMGGEGHLQFRSSSAGSLYDLLPVRSSAGPIQKTSRDLTEIGPLPDRPIRRPFNVWEIEGEERAKIFFLLCQIPFPLLVFLRRHFLRGPGGLAGGSIIKTSSFPKGEEKGAEKYKKRTLA